MTHHSIPSQILLVATIAALVGLTACGDTTAARPAPVHPVHTWQTLFNQATSKQDLLATVLRSPPLRSIPDSECGRYAAMLHVDYDANIFVPPSVAAYGVRLPSGDLAAFDARFQALPGAQALAAQQAKDAAAAKEKADADAAAARYAGLPVVDHRALLRSIQQDGIHLPAPATGSTTAPWSPVAIDDVPATDLTGIFVSSNEQTIIAYGPTSTLRSDDAGTTWRPAGPGMTDAYLLGTKVYGLDADGRLVSDAGFIVDDNLPKAYRIAVAYHTIAIETKTTVQWLSVDDAGVPTFIGKQPKPDNTAILVAVTKDGAAILALRGGRAVALRPDGVPVLAPAIAQLNATCRLTADHQPESATPTTIPVEYQPMFDGGFLAGGTPGATAAIGQSWALIDIGIVDVAVRDDGGQVCITDTISATDSNHRTRSPASDTVPAGTRSIAACGPNLWAVGTAGLYRTPRWPGPATATATGTAP